MQNGTANNATSQQHNVGAEQQADLELPEAVEDASNHVNGDGPPTKKRKVSEPASIPSASRPPSPPWKKHGAEGPTSFVEGGRRKSTRTNPIPLELQPSSGKRQTRAAQSKYLTKTGAAKQGKATSPQPGAPLHTNVNGGRPRQSARYSAGGQSGKSAEKDMKYASAIASPNSRVQVQDTPSKSLTRPTRHSLRHSASISNLNGSPGKDSPSTRTQHDTSTYKSSRFPLLRFRVNLAPAPILHPQHVLPPKKYANLREYVENEAAGLDDDENFADLEAARTEALTRLRIGEELQEGGLLSAELCSKYIPEKEEEPDRSYTHQDYFVSHALYFRKLLSREREQHMQNAKKLAYACAEVYRIRKPKTKEEVEEEKREAEQKSLVAHRRQLLGDLRRFWELVRVEVQALRLARWEEEQKVKGAKALDQAIRVQKKKYQSQRLTFEDQSSIADSGQDYEDDEDQLEEEEEEDGDDSDDDDDDDDEDADEDVEDPDAGLTQEQIRLKYSHIPDIDFDEDPQSDPDASRADGRNSEVEPQTDLDVASQLSGSDTEDNERLKDVHLDDVDAALLDDSDESTDMSDDMGSSDEDDDESDAESGSEEEDEEEQSGLLGLLFSRKEIAKVEESEPGRPTEELDSPSYAESEQPISTGLLDIALGDDTVQKPLVTVNGSKSPMLDEEGEISALTEQKKDFATPIDTSLDISSQISPPTAATKLSEADTGCSMEPAKDIEEVPRELTPVNKFKVPVPGLLRGSLREYQHQGLEWLAGLYADHTNGILADEMGLGKTIQSIALLSHVAMEHEVWGPHLIVVPTSVILNWEMEFKKWAPGFKIMTYYGNIEERKAKRKGWTEEDNWHVLITSYELVLKDQQVLRRRKWHYMILDEAHNIKNFQSQRWQTLLNFRTDARLLLTGTPLQNNLNELWSLLFFLMPSDDGEAASKGFAELQQFSEWFRNPEQRILNQGRDTMNEQDKETISKLHQLLRPYLLRRVKAEVEKQMPGKYEHVIYCKLSKRQREYYDGFMSRNSTRNELASGNHFSIMNCLMQLRKVCNHPDLFESRQITTSFAMSRSAVADFEIKDLLVRRRLLREDPANRLNLDFLNLAPVSKESLAKHEVESTAKIMAFTELGRLRAQQYKRTNWLMQYDRSTFVSTRDAMDNELRKKRMAELETCLYFESKRHGQRPIYGRDLLEKLTIGIQERPLEPRPRSRKLLPDWFANQSTTISSMIKPLSERAQLMEQSVRIFGCVTPKVVTAESMAVELPENAVEVIRSSQNVPGRVDPFHEARMRLSIAFPDKRLLQYDCGKLQALDKLLRELQAGGHRALIFTQMVSMLDILEQFINIHGHRYLRLDGSTKVDQRQFLTQRFNNDNRILAFLLSSRAGGLGLNLTGADTVIFYDLDWNPAMDKQCQDRAHRIGQTRDVHIYRLISEYTIETNILRKSNQKRMLDDVVIQEGGFTTDYNPEMMEEEDEMAEIMDKVLGNTNNAERLLAQVEDQEDADAAKRAELELQDADAADFGDETKASSLHNTPKPSEPPTPSTTGLPTLAQDSATPIVKEVTAAHIDNYLVRFMEWDLRDEEIAPPKDKSRRRKKRGHRMTERARGRRAR